MPLPSDWTASPVVLHDEENAAVFKVPQWMCNM